MYAPLKLWIVVLAFAQATTPLRAEDRAKRVRQDLDDIVAGGKWIYNDLPKGFEEARKSGRPLLVVIRCIPCEACRGFDEQVAGLDPKIRLLLDRFVRVRIPQANGLDLALFQFDFDLSFYAFFLNADRTIYGRFGTRSTQEDTSGAVSLDAFREALEETLKLHEKYGEVKDQLRDKTGAAPEIKVPEEHPLLKGKYKSTIDYQGEVVRSCIHCHQIRDSEMLSLRSARQPIPDKVLFPWPLPEVFGLGLDPKKRASVASVEKGSVAERGGFQTGDELVALQGQPLVSIADVQWILHNTGEEGELTARVRRGGEEKTLKIPLDRGWRKKSDLSWRVTTWDLRRMATGGLLLEGLPAEDRRQAGLSETDLALRVKYAGEGGEHGIAKNAGFRKGDIIVAVDGKTAPWRETDLIAYGVQQHQPGDRLAFTVLREGKRREISFALK